MGEPGTLNNSKHPQPPSPNLTANSNASPESNTNATAISLASIPKNAKAKPGPNTKTDQLPSASNTSNINTTVPIGISTLPYPVLVASGTFGYGEEYRHISDYSKFGGIVCKTVTKDARLGNPPPRVYETESGSLNSIGLANGGAQYFVKTILPKIADYPCPYIVNIAAKSNEEFIELLEYIQNAEGAEHIWGWELNMSCPNVSEGTNFGKDPASIYTIVSALRARTRAPLLVKLPPNVNDIGILGKAAEEAGADAISAINTLVGMWINTKTRKPVFARRTGGLSGTAIFPVALALVFELCQKATIPVLGIGGISNGDQAIQFLLAGAKAVQIGSANFRDPTTANQCVVEIIEYCRQQNLQSIQEIVLD